MRGVMVSDLAGIAASMVIATAAGWNVSPTDVPPESALPISEIVAILEDRESGVLTQIEFDDRVWEAQLNVGPASGVRIEIDPSDGSEIRRHDDERAEQPPANAMALSEILNDLENQDFGLIYDVEFDDGYWEIEAKREGTDVKIKIDPVTGEPKR